MRISSESIRPGPRINLTKLFFSNLGAKNTIKPFLNSSKGLKRQGPKKTLSQGDSLRYAHSEKISALPPWKWIFGE
jgi:hypothetical protein